MSDAAEDRSEDLVARWRQGDQNAAAILFHRYANRLIALAGSRLSGRLGQRVDPEDVVQSVYRCFFAKAREGRYLLQRAGELWQLLARITLHKLRNQDKHHRRLKRATGRECVLSDQADLAVDLSREPSAIEAVALADQLEQVMRRLEPLYRRVLELRLQGCTLEEIATQVDRSERTVCRVLDEIKDCLREWD